MPMTLEKVDVSIDQGNDLRGKIVREVKVLERKINELETKNEELTCALDEKGYTDIARKYVRNQQFGIRNNMGNLRILKGFLEKLLKE